MCTDFFCWKIDLCLTPYDPCVKFPLAMHYALVRSSCYQNWCQKAIPKQFDIWLTPNDTCMAFDDLSNVLRSGQGFFKPRLTKRWLQPPPPLRFLGCSNAKECDLGYLSNLFYILSVHFDEKKLRVPPYSGAG